MTPKRRLEFLFDVLLLLWLVAMIQGLKSSESFAIEKNSWKIFFQIPTEGLFSRDALENLLLGLPGGVLLGLRVNSFWLSLALSAAVIGAVGTGMEVLQWWIPGRTPSAWDVLAIGLGGLCGTLSVAPFKRYLERVLVEHSTREVLPHFALILIWIGSGFIPEELILRPIQFSFPVFLSKGMFDERLLLHVVSWVQVAVLLKVNGRGSFAMIFGLFSLRIFGLIVAPGRGIEPEAIPGFVIFLILWWGASKQVNLKLATLLTILYLLARAFPSGGAPLSVAFTWNPAVDFLRDGMLGALRYLCEDLFPLIVLPAIWSLSLSKARYLVAAAGTLGLLFLLELYRFSCCALPGSTAPLMLFAAVALVNYYLRHEQIDS